MTATYDLSWLLTEDEFAALSPDERKRYLTLLERAALEWVLLPKQAKVDAVADAADYTLFGGSAGPGKSAWLLHRAQRLSREYPGHATLALRRTFPQLRQTLIRKSQELYPALIPADERPVWRAADKEWRFPNGSIIQFGHCQYDESVGDYLSAEYDLIMFDEQTQFTLHQYTMISSRARTAGPKRDLGVRPHVIGATNPGQVGHTWNKELFIDPTNYGESETHSVERVDERSGDQHTEVYGYVHSTAHDNPHVGREYMAKLLAMSEVDRKRYLYGDWDIFEGLYFEEFDRSVHVVSDEQFREIVPSGRIPDEWPRRAATDYGSYAPFCTLWGAWDQDGTLWIYRELYEAGLTPKEQAQWILRVQNPTGRSPERIEMHVADPSMWGQTHRSGGQGMSVADQYIAEGVSIIQARNDRIAGWARVRDYLRRDGFGQPGIRILGDRCPNLVRTLPLQQRDEDNPEDIDTEGEDHAPDTVRYLCSTRDRRWNRPAEPDPDAARKDPRLARLAKRRARRAR